MKDGNIGQQEAYKVFINNINLFISGELYKNVFSLTGSAGTGKTWWTSQLIRELLNLDLTIAMTTPTHKALQVVEGMLTKDNINILECNTSTIHNFLNLKLDYGFGDDGSADNVSTKPKLKINKFNECLKYVDVLLIDESSMVSEELYNLAISTLGDRSKIVLFIGDQYQLTPVEGGENIIYDHPDVVHMILNETVRQKEGSDIIIKASQLVEMIKYKKYPAEVYTLFEQSESFNLVQESEFLPTYFEDETDKIIGSYTNKMIDQYNKYVRYVVTKELEYLAEEDEIVFQKPYSNAKGDVIFQNGQSVIIQSTRLTQDKSTGLWYWRCKGDYKMFNILDPSSEQTLKEKLDELSTVAKRANGYDKSKAWKAFFKLQTRFGIIKYAFASTLHKLQGSTCTTIYFDMRDLISFYRRDPDNVLRLIYVAITRPTDKVNILK